MKTETKFRTCHLCEAMCGLEIEVANNEVISIKGHQEDIYSQGHICPKGVALKDLHEDPNRLKRPVKRTADGWKEISWKEAYDTVEQNFKRIRNQFGNDAIGTYTGNPTVHNTGTALYLYDTINAINTRNRFASHSLDSVPVFVVNQMMYGHAMLAPIPDIENINYFLIIGANPMASNGSFMSTPNIRGKIKNIQEKGGKVVVVDPRKTETAKKASEHHFIIPEQDVLLLSAIINEIFRRQAVKESKVLAFTENIDTLKSITAPYTIDKIAPLTGLSAAAIHSIVDDLLSHSNPVVYGRLGINTQTYGTLCQWLIQSINILVGSLDRPGGLMFTLPAIDYVTLMAHESKMYRYQSRVGKFDEIVGEYPTATLPDEILTEGEGQIKALLCIAGNIARSAPNSSLVEKALQALDFMVAVDMYINETTQYADIILPPAVGLETMHYSFVLHMVATKNTVKFSPSPLPIAAYQRYDWQIMSELQRRLYDGHLIGRIKNNLMSRLKPEAKLDLALKTGPYGIWGGRKFQKNGLSLKRLKRHPEGIGISKLKPVFPERLFTDNQKINIAPTHFVQAHKAILSLLKPETNDQFPLKLIGRRHLRSNNSWMHNLPLLAGGSRQCTVMMHPQDADEMQVKNQDMVEVYSAFGCIQIEAEISSDIIRGTVSIPHGWGHDAKNTQLDVANKTAGANVNALMDHSRLCNLSYNMAFNGQPVAVRKLTQETT